LADIPVHSPLASAYPVLHVVHVLASPVHTKQPVLSEGVHAEKISDTSIIYRWGRGAHLSPRLI